MSEQPVTTNALRWFADLTLSEQTSLSFKYYKRETFNLTVREIIEMYTKTNKETIRT